MEHDAGSFGFILKILFYSALYIEAVYIRANTRTCARYLQSVILGSNGEMGEPISHAIYNTVISFMSSICPFCPFHQQICYILFKPHPLAFKYNFQIGFAFVWKKTKSIPPSRRRTFIKY